MITLKKKQEILLMYLREGRSQREIANLTGVDRKTISKYIREYETKREELQQCDTSLEVGELIQTLVEAPAYKTGARAKRVLTKEVEGKIKQHLAENEQKRQAGLRKQVKKPIDIFEALEQEGILISYSTVLRTIRQLEVKQKEAYIKESYSPGQICEFDWGEVKLEIAGQRKTFQMAAFASAYGNYRMAYLFTKQKTECFQEAHALFFEDVGGVFQCMVYDNMRVAVKRFIGNEKEPTDGLLKLSLYYAFQYRFCNAERGNEKGHVERSIEVIRRKAFSHRDCFSTLEEANQYLKEICHRLNGKPQRAKQNLTAHALLDEERKYLLPHLPMFDAARLQSARVDKYATVVVDQSHYSVPDTLVGRYVQVKIYSTRVQCFYEGQKVAEHERLTGCHEWRLDLEHYLQTLQKKPGALAGSAALQQADQRIQQIYQSYYTNRAREFIELMHYLKEEGNLEEIQCSIEELQRIHPSHVTTDKIKAVCAKKREPAALALETEQETKDITERAKEHLKMYDELFQTQRVGHGEENKWLH